MNCLRANQGVMACGMNRMLSGNWRRCGIALGAGLMLAANAGGAESPAPEQLHIYSGSTHAHSQFTWSHGEQWAGGDAGEGKQKMRHTPEGVQLPPAGAKTRPISKIEKKYQISSMMI
jgi:hypothetical protein